MSSDQKPRPYDWDWVSERARCSEATMFETLLAMARDNVKMRNSQNAEENKYQRFQISEPQGNGYNFGVVDTRTNFERRVVSVNLDRATIRVRKTWDTEDAVYTLSLNDQGECRLVNGGVELQPWQVMRRALEGLFFGQ